MDAPRSGSGTVGSGGKDRKVTAAVTSSGSERDHSAKNSSTSRLPVERVVEVAAVHRGDRDQPELQLGDDAEVAGAARQAPEQVGVLGRRWP